MLAASDIIEVVGSCVELKPAGSGRFKARCPFHNEKTPSFTVSRDRQFFHCFGCDKSGDAIAFLMEFEGLTFQESLRKLADRASIRLPALTEQDGKEDYLRAQLVEFGKFAAKHFREQLADVLKGSAARQYVKSRGLQSTTLDKFGLGFAPEGWSGLVTPARAAGYKDTVIEASGLAKRGERGDLYDFFRNRLMIPIKDVSGNVVAFGGRDLGDGMPKYINSPENALYKKTRVLYGLYEARDAMRREKRAILVEGYFDLMRCFDAGIENVVATCGTALTAEQASLIHRYVPEVVVVYDSDAAGIRAALRGVGLLVNAGLTVRAMTLPDGKDPDDFIRAHGGDAFRTLIEESLDFVTFYVRMSGDRTVTIEGRTAVAKEVFTILASLSDELRRGEYIKRVARELQLNEWTCQSEFSKFLREQSGRTPRTEELKPKAAPASQDDRGFAAALMRDLGLLRQAKDYLASVALPSGPLSEVLEALFEEQGPTVGLRLASEEARLLYAAAANEPEMPADAMHELVAKRMARLHRDALQAEAEQLKRALAEAERAKDQARVMEVLRALAGINRLIQSVDAA